MTSAPSPLPVMATLDFEKISLRHVDRRNSHRRSSCIDHTCDARHDYRYLPRIICYTSVRRNTREIDAQSVGVYSVAKLRGMQFYSVARVHLRQLILVELRLRIIAWNWGTVINIRVVLEPRLRFKVRPGRASAVVVFILWGTDVRGQICCIPGLYTSSRVVAHDKQPFQRQTDWISGSWMRWQCHSVFRSECVAPGQSCRPILLHTSRTFRPQCAMRPPRQGCVINRSAHCCLQTTVFDTNSFL